MIRIMVPFFYDLGAALSQLSGLKSEMALMGAWAPLWETKNKLEAMFREPWLAPAIKSAWNPGQRLLQAVTAVTDRSDLLDGKLTFLEVHSIDTARNEFVAVIRAELATADVYFVTRKGAYDVSSLIANAESLCSTDLGIKVPTAIQELREGGRCLAFELSTAAGFHMLRATELVLRMYWDATSNGMPHPDQKNLGAYLKVMEKSNVGSPKVVATLKQIKDLHRNPLMHPEESLTVTEAIGLVGICVSAMNAMLKEIPSPSPATEALVSSSADGLVTG